jgi:putative ABC transport system permease protein
VSAPALPVAALLATVLGATLVTVVAVLAPARSAAKVAPLQALREAAVTDGRGGIGWGRLAAGLLCLAGALGGAGLVWNSVPGPEAENYDPSYLLLGTVGSGFLAFCALMALGPVLVRPILAAIAWPARLLGPVGRLAVGGVGGAPRRAAAVSVVVGLGVTLVAGTLVGAASLQAYIDRSMAITSPTDFEVSADTTLPPAVVQQLATNPKLTRIAPYRRIEAQLDGREGVAADLKWGSVRALAQVEPAAGSFGDLRPGRAILSGWLARELKKTVGDTVTVTAGTGTAQVTVAVVLPDGAPLGASVLVDPADLDRLGVPAGPAGVLADAAQPGAAGRSAAAEVLTPLTEQGVAVQFLGEEREETLDQVAAVVWIAMGLIGLTVLIAVVGVGSTTALSVVERMRESGLLRAVGLSRRRLLATLTAEAGLYGLLGAILGIGLGIPYAWLTVYVLNIGAPLRLPLGQLITVAVILALVTALAGVLPARRAAKVSPVTALGSAE